MRGLFRHFGLKVISLALATLLWLLVAGQREAERSLRVPLEYRNVPDQIELLGEPASLVDVRLRGTSGALGAVARHRSRRGDRLASGAAGPAAVPPVARRRRRAHRRQGAAGVAADAVVDLRGHGLAHGPGRPRHRRRAGAGVRGDASHVGSGDRRRGRACLRGAQRHRGNHRARQRAWRHASGDRHGVDRRARLERAPPKSRGTRSSPSRFGRCRSSASSRQCPSSCATLAPASAPRRIRPP